MKKSFFVILIFIGIPTMLYEPKFVQCVEPTWKLQQKLDSVSLWLPLGNEDVRLARLSDGYYELYSTTGQPLVGRDLSGGKISFDPYGDDLEPDLKLPCLDKANLRGFATWRVTAANVSLQDADLRDAEIEANCSYGWNVTGADIRGAKLRLKSDQLRSTKSYRMRDLTGWEGATLAGFGGGKPTIEDVNFRGFDLSQAIFRCSVPGCDFTDAVISGANCSGLTLEQIKQTWNCKYGHMESVTVSDEVKAALNAEKEKPTVETNETPGESKAESGDSKATGVVESTELEKEKPLAESAKTAD
ncbi:MAG: hypothetical protein PHE53_13170 [Thermoguttaceae bacterium]|nr:hypothetical protein [Thermoguttaceae bacterium]